MARVCIPADLAVPRDDAMFDFEWLSLGDQASPRGGGPLRDRPGERTDPRLLRVSLSLLMSENAVISGPQHQSETSSSAIQLPMCAPFWAVSRNSRCCRAPLGGGLRGPRVS